MTRKAEYQPRQQKTLFRAGGEVAIVFYAPPLENNEYIEFSYFEGLRLFAVIEKKTTGEIRNPPPG